MHQQQSGMTSQLKSKEALQSSCISDLLHKLSTQAVTSTGLAPQIKWKRVFGKRSLTDAEGAVCEIAHKKKMSLSHRNYSRHVDYRRAFWHLLFLLFKQHTQVCKAVFMWRHWFLFLLHSFIYILPKFQSFCSWNTNNFLATIYLHYCHCSPAFQESSSLKASVELGSLTKHDVE